jgi:hypothetical protein
MLSADYHEVARRHLDRAEEAIELEGNDAVIVNSSLHRVYELDRYILEEVANIRRILTKVETSVTAGPDTPHYHLNNDGEVRGHALSMDLLIARRDERIGELQRLVHYILPERQ